MKYTLENHTRTVLIRGRRGKPSLVIDAAPGQALVLIALLIVFLLGLMALALDGGGLFLLRRQAQNAADAAALAAAYARCADGNPGAVQTAGRDAAELNKFDDAAPDVQVILNNPYNGDDNLVEALVTAEKPAYFVQVIYQGPLFVTGRAVAKCVEVFDSNSVRAVMSLGTCEQCVPQEDTFDSSGSQANFVGGILSNCDCRFQADTTIDGIECYNRSDDDVCDDYTEGGGVDIECSVAPTPPDEIADDPFADFIKIEDYAPGGKYAIMASMVSEVCNADTYDAGTGCYHPYGASIGPINGNSHTFEGLYYVNGDIRINNRLNVGPRGATFVLTGSIVINASNAGITGWRNYVQETGLIVYTTHDPGEFDCTAEDVKIIGAATTWEGLIYGPKTRCTWSGADGTGYGAIVCKRIDLSGSRFDLIYNPNLFEFPPPEVGFVED